ncbi:hypothetical protein QZH41_003653 [Actinostola sp. cb2023]|nr:hypothetical protein QZH41_003653 [Actinostola sp. cb2023]
MIATINLTCIQRLQEQLRSRELGTVITESFFVIFINLSTLLGNLLVLTAVFRNPRLRQNICNIYIIALSVSDLMMSVLGIPFTSAATVAGRWPVGHLYCQIQGFFVLLLCAASLQTLALTAVNRYFRMTRSSVVYRRYFTMRSTKATVIILWIMALLAPLPYVAMGEEFIFHPGKVFCTHNFASLVIGYGSFLVLSYVVIPIIIIIFCYTKVFFSVRRHNASFRVHTINAPADQEAPNLRLSVDEINITWTLLAVVLGFMVSWTPVVVIDMIDFANGDWKLSRRAYLSYSCFGYSSTAINPFIYGVMNRHFREEYSKVFPFIKAFVSRSQRARGDKSPKNDADRKSTNEPTRKSGVDMGVIPTQQTILPVVADITVKKENVEKEPVVLERPDIGNRISPL